jgi:hypothetical protein
LLMIFTGPLSWKSFFSPILSILRFGLLIVSWISWMFLVRSFLHFAFSLTAVSIFSMVSSTPEIPSSDSFIPTPDLFPSFYISRVVSLWDLFIVSISIFRSWINLFNYFTYFFKGLICFLFKAFYLFTCVLL